jgi:Skp family chaperone for outer membrane proteins
MEKKSVRRGIFIFSACLAAFPAVFASAALALEIPVSAASSAEGKALRIAYADMELIYNVCPQKARATKEYRDAKDAYETAIASITAAIAVRRGETERLQKEIEEFRRETSGGPVVVSTGNQPSDADTSADQLPAPASSDAPPAETVESVYRKELSRKAADTQISELESALEKSRQEMASELSDIEKNCSMDILQTIYKALEQIAVEEELLVIIDKNYILYAPEAYDITSKVIDRLK